MERIKNEYGTTYVDLVISTHPDSDHINGLHVILEELTVEELWMHTPWNISDEVRKMAEDRTEGNFLGSENKIKKSLQTVYDLEQLAIKKGVRIVEPFEGLSAFDKTIQVLGPTMDYYYELAADFDTTPNPVASFMSTLIEKVKETITERWHEDKLEDPADDAVSARNNSSVITLVQLDKNFIFFGDAGAPAITKAANYAATHNYDLATKIHYFHVPHHGSKRNLGPTILNQIVGPILPENQESGKIAFISAAVGHPKHPSKRVRNALRRRGLKVAETCGEDHCYRSSDVPSREGWGPITYAEFCDTYDEE